MENTQEAIIPAVISHSSDKGSFKVFWDEQNKVVQSIAIGETDEPMAKDMVQGFITVLNQYPSHGNLIIDVTKNTKVTTEARRVFEAFHKRDDVQKVAFIGASLYIRVLVNFVMTTTRVSKTKFFVNVEDATRWLNQQ